MLLHSRRPHDRGDCPCRSYEPGKPTLRSRRLLGVLALVLLSTVPVAALGCSTVAAQAGPTPTVSKVVPPTALPTVAPSVTATVPPTPIPVTPTATSVPATLTPTPRPQVLGPNLLPNPSFEDMVDGMPEGWTSAPGVAPLHVVRPGNNGSFAVGFSGGVPDTSLLLHPKDPIPVYPGQTYKFVGWARGGGLSRGCAQVSFQGVEDGNAVCFTDPPNSASDKSPVPYTWTRAEFTVNIPQGVTAIDFSLTYFWTGDSAAQVYWDDLYFGELERY